MFILRIIQEDRMKLTVEFGQVIENFELGSSYSILKKDITPEFDAIMKAKYPEVDSTQLIGIICGENGTDFFIEKDTEDSRRSYYLMTESGKTFERL